MSYQSGNNVYQSSIDASDCIKVVLLYIKVALMAIKMALMFIKVVSMCINEYQSRINVSINLILVDSLN